MENEIVKSALEQGASFLSESESKKLLAEFGVTASPEIMTRSVDEAADFAFENGYPVVLKGCGRTLLHKTEMGLVDVGIRDESDLRARFDKMLGNLPAEADGILVAKSVDAKREFIAGLTQDEQYGPVVMFGLGGIFTETLKDVEFRVAPIEKVDAEEMIEQIKSSKLLGQVRGMPAVDQDALCDLLVAIGRIGAEVDGVLEIDVNPILFDNGKPVAADALIKIGTK